MMTETDLSTIEEFKSRQERLLQGSGVVAESRFLEIPAIDGNAHVMISGDGPPVVMVPGFGDPAAMWAPLMAELEGFTLYAVDRPCFGLTDPVTHNTTTFRKLATRFLEQALDALKLEKPVFVGNSIGSLWTIWFALDRPERVTAMTHIGCPAFILGTSAPFPMRLLSVPPIGRLLMKMTPPSPKQVEKFANMVGEDLSVFPEMRNMLVSLQKTPHVRPAILELLHAVVRLRGARPEVALTADLLSRITQPVQLIWGERDPFGGPEIGRQAADILPNAEFHLIPGGGHVPWINSPGLVGKISAPSLRKVT